MDIRFNIVFKDFKEPIQSAYFDMIEETIDHYDWIIENRSRIKGIRYISIYIDNKPISISDLRIMDLLTR